MNLSPWFYPSEPPVREGRYQVKDWIGHINYAEFEGRLWWSEPRSFKNIPTHRIRAWRGVIKL